MAGLMQRYGGERVAALMAAEDGLEWNQLTPEDKELYYSKAFQKKQDQQYTMPAGKPDNKKQKMR